MCCRRPVYWLALNVCTKRKKRRMELQGRAISGEAMTIKLKGVNTLKP